MAGEMKTREIVEQRVVFCRDAKAWKNMRVAYVVSTEFAEFDGHPHEKEIP